MIIYMLNFLMIGIYSIACDVLKEKVENTSLKRFFVVLVTVQLILVLALRYVTVGVDVSRYVAYFQTMPYYSSLDALLISSRYELCYKLFNKFISFFTMNEQIFLSFVAIVSMVPVGRFIYKYSKMPLLSFALYIAFGYYSFNFSGLRQAMAFAITLSSYDYIRERKLSKFIICIILASLFHKSAFSFLPAYFITNLKLNKATVGIIMSLNMLLFLFRKQILTFVISTIYSSYHLVESTSFSWMTLCLVILLFGAIFYKDMMAVSEKNNALYVFLTVGVSVMLYASVGTNVMRVANYYYIFVILFIPEVMSSVKNKQLVMLGKYILVVCAILLYVWSLGVDGYQIVPYRFFWE